MPHVRQTIREDAATALAAIGPTVYKMRSYALAEADLPAICVFTSSESSNLHAMGTRTLMRRLELVVEAVVKEPEATVEDTLDARCAAIEAIMVPSVSSALKEIYLTGTEIQIDTDSGSTIGTASLTFMCNYITLASDAETAR